MDFNQLILPIQQYYLVIMSFLVITLLLHYKGRSSYWEGFVAGIKHNQSDDLDEWYMDEIQWLRTRLRIQLEANDDEPRSV